MLCFEVRLNGDPVVTMGHEQLQLMSLDLEYYAELSHIELSSFGGLRKMTAPPDVVSWFEPLGSLQAGDEILVRIIESPVADTPVKPVPANERPQQTLYCTFCDRPSEGRRMITVVRSICEDCIKKFHSKLING